MKTNAPTPPQAMLKMLGDALDLFHANGGEMNMHYTSPTGKLQADMLSSYFAIVRQYARDVDGVSNRTLQ